MMSKFYHSLSKSLFILAWLSIAILAISQVLGRFIWQLELFSHFVPHYALILWLAVIFYPKNTNSINFQDKKFNQKFRWVFLMIAIALAFWCFLPLLNKMPPIKPTRQQPITIGYQNVNLNNENYHQVLGKISQNAQADTLILLEANPQWRNEVKKFNPNYQLVCGNEEYSPFAIQIFSKNAVKCEILSLAKFPMAKLTLSDGRIVFAVHPPPPINGELANARLAYIGQLKALIKAEKPAVLVIGDMNLSAFSPVYRDFVKNTGLFRKFDYGVPTWLPLGISIDQILISYDFADTKPPIPLSWNGSDHRGLFVQW